MAESQGIESAWRAALAAAESDNAKELMRIVREEPEIKIFWGVDASDWTDDARGIFHMAAKFDSVECVEALANEGLDIHDIWAAKNGKFVYSYTPLSLAIMCDDVGKRHRMLAAMTRRPARAGGSEDAGWQVAMLAAANEGDLWAMKTIFAHVGPAGSELWAKATNGRRCNILHFVAMRGILEALNFVLDWPGMEHCARQRNVSNRTPAMEARHLGEDVFASALAARLVALNEARELSDVAGKPEGLKPGQKRSL